MRQDYFHHVYHQLKEHIPIKQGLRHLLKVMKEFAV